MPLLTLRSFSFLMDSYTKTEMGLTTFFLFMYVTYQRCSNIKCKKEK